MNLKFVLNKVSGLSWSEHLTLAPGLGRKIKTQEVLRSTRQPTPQKTICHIVKAGLQKNSFIKSKLSSANVALLTVRHGLKYSEAHAEETIEIAVASVELALEDDVNRHVNQPAMSRFQASCASCWGYNLPASAVLRAWQDFIGTSNGRVPRTDSALRFQLHPQ